MKKYLTLALFLVTFTIAGFAQSNKPKATYQVGSAKITVWENERDGKYGKFTAKDFEVEKIYKKDGKWESTNNFTRDELLQLRAAIDKVIDNEAVEVTKTEVITEDD